jgi:hypothetical protein
LALKAAPTIDNCFYIEQPRNMYSFNLKQICATAIIYKWLFNHLLTYETVKKVYE